jgi:hypothetical protein
MIVIHTSENHNHTTNSANYLEPVFDVFIDV